MCSGRFVFVYCSGLAVWVWSLVSLNFFRTRSITKDHQRSLQPLAACGVNQELIYTYIYIYIYVYIVYRTVCSKFLYRTISIRAKKSSGQRNPMMRCEGEHGLIRFASWTSVQC